MSAFSVMLAVPLLGTMLGVNSAAVTSEKRQLAQMPKWKFNWKTLSEFPGQFEAFYNDHFGGTFLAWRSRIEVFLLHQSPTPLVVIGKDGWLFYAGDSTNQESITEYAGLVPLSPKSLQSMWTSLVQRKQWLAKQGIRYLFVIAPNKHTIYPEYLGNTKRIRHRETRLDQFVAYMNQHAFRDFIDLRETMTAAKTNGVLYYKIDSHWNMLGGWIAQRRILDRISEDLPLPGLTPLSEFQRTHLKKEWGDLTILMGVNGGFLDDDILLEPPQPAPVPLKTPYSSGDSKGFATKLPDERLPTVVVFGDSFLDAYLADFLAEHFSKAVFIRSAQFDPIVVQREQPDLVVTETVERNLISAAAPNLASVQ